MKPKRVLYKFRKIKGDGTKKVTSSFTFQDLNAALRAAFIGYLSLRHMPISITVYGLKPKSYNFSSILRLWADDKNFRSAKDKIAAFTGTVFSEDEE